MKAKGVAAGHPHVGFHHEPATLQRQADLMPEHADYRENQRWQHQGVVFATFHTVGPTNGFDVQLKVSAGTVTATPYYWLAGSWWPIGDAVFAPKNVTATFATVPAASARFARAAEGLYWALLSTGGGTVDTCEISEAVF